MTSANLQLGHQQLGQPAINAFQGRLRHELRAVGLRPYEARVLLALLPVEAADSATLATLSGVPRTSIYTVMATLTQRGLAEALPSDGSMVWTSVGWRAALDALGAAEEERVDLHHRRTRALSRALHQTFPSRSSVRPVS